MTTKPTQQQIELEVLGMTCDSCALHVTKALRGVDGVIEAQVPGWSSGRATVMAESGVSDEAMTEAIKETGYRARVLTHRDITAPAQPEGWGPRPDYDLVVIGTGGAGMAAAIRSAELGRRVCIVEAGTIGGTCVNIGCVPSKALFRAAEAYHSAGHHPFAGVHTRAEGLDWPAVIGQKDRLVSELRESKYVDVLASYGDRITLTRGRARLQTDGSVVLDDGQVCRPGKIVIATGARPRILPLDGIENVEVLDSTSAMALEVQPRSLIVIGGRAVALELGQTFARFGTQVTILQRSPRILPEHEPEISEALADYLREEGLIIHTGVALSAIRQACTERSRSDDGEKVIAAEVNGQPREFRAEQVLMATGRTPNTKDMGLEAVGIELDESGFIVVDDYMQTSHPHVYAAGDVTNRPKLIYVAAAGGGIAAENALNEVQHGNSRRLDLTVLPDVVFTDPQVATVGLTEAQATAQGYDVKVSSLPLAYVPRALAARDTRGLIKLVADRNSDRLLGAHVLAAEAGEVIQTAALAVKFGLQYGFTVTELRQMLFPYLVQVEGLKLAAMAFEKDVAQLSCCAG